MINLLMQLLSAVFAGLILFLSQVFPLKMGESYREQTFDFKDPDISVCEMIMYKSLIISFCNQSFKYNDNIPPFPVD